MSVESITKLFAGNPALAPGAAAYAPHAETYTGRPGIEDVVLHRNVPAGYAIELDSAVSGSLSQLLEHAGLGQQRLIATVPAGGKLLGVVEVRQEGLPPAVAVVDIRQTEPEYDTMDKPTILPRFLTWVEPNQHIMIGSASFPSLGREVPPELCAISVDQAGKTRIGHPNHQVAIDVPDRMPRQETPFDYMSWMVRGRLLSERGQGASTVRIDTAPTPTVAAEVRPQKSPEFRIGSNHFRLVGRDPSGYWVMTSRDTHGQQRRFLVYHSRSEGSWRVSQGREESDPKPHTRLLKGMEGNREYQYTQDTQLHPDFERALFEGILDTEADEAAVPQSLILNGTYTPDQVELLIRDFEEQVRVLPLTRGLDAQLHRLRTGRLKTSDIATLAGSEDRRRMDRAFRHEINELNRLLARADVLPDFTRPIRTGYAEHPVLGPCSSEVFAKVVNGRTVEWYMSRDSEGRVWVERIRFADSGATAYGTDSELVFAGILTSKPLEYKKQAEGIPAEMRTDSANENYYDITRFLNELLPIQRYRAALPLRDRGKIYADGKVF